MDSRGFPVVPLLCDSSDRCEAPVGLYGNGRDLMFTGQKVGLPLLQGRGYLGEGRMVRELSGDLLGGSFEKGGSGPSRGLCMILRQEPELPRQPSTPATLRKGLSLAAGITVSMNRVVSTEVPRGFCKISFVIILALFFPCWIKDK